jgi:hypothetical protein
MLYQIFKQKRIILSLGFVFVLLGSLAVVRFANAAATDFFSGVSWDHSFSVGESTYLRSGFYETGFQYNETTPDSSFFTLAPIIGYRSGAMGADLNLEIELESDAGDYLGRLEIISVDDQADSNDDGFIQFWSKIYKTRHSTWTEDQGGGTTTLNNTHGDFNLVVKIYIEESDGTRTLLSSKTLGDFNSNVDLASRFGTGTSGGSNSGNQDNSQQTNATETNQNSDTTPTGQNSNANPTGQSAGADPSGQASNTNPNQQSQTQIGGSGGGQNSNTNQTQIGGSPSNNSSQQNQGSSTIVSSGCVDGSFSCLGNPLGQGGVKSFTGFIERVLNIVIRLGIPVVVLAIIWSGFLYVKAQGNSEQVKKAHQALMWTIVGAVLLIGSYTIATAIQKTVTDIGTGSFIHRPSDLV